MPGTRTRLAAAIALAVGVLPALSAGAAPAAVRTLPCSTGPYQKGWGHVRPSVIFNGGDPTGLVEHIHWTTYGDTRAVGHGIGDWVWPGVSVAGGSVRTPAVIV